MSLKSKNHLFSLLLIFSNLLKEALLSLYINTKIEDINGFDMNDTFDMIQFHIL